MKILLLTNSFQRINNGPSKFANYVLEMKSITGGEHEVRVATEDVPEGKFGTEGPVYHVPLTFPKWAKPIGQFLRMRLYLNKANEVYKNYPFDALVYINAFNGFYATFQKRHPVFGMVNDAKNVVGNWAHFKPTLGWARLWLFRTLEVAATRRMRMVITNSEYLKQTLLAQYPLDAAKVKRLYKSTESQGIIPKFERDFGEHIKVLFLKTDYRVGALDVVCQALGQLNSYQFELTVVGPVPSAEPVIEQMIVDKPHITLRFLGEQPQDRVREEQNRCDFMCVPSRSEALGVANMEAALTGTPIVSSTVGGIPEVTDGELGAWLAPAGDAEGLAQQIQNCISQPEERLKRQHHVREHVLRTFDKEEMLWQFVELVKEGVKVNWRMSSGL